MNKDSRHITDNFLGRIMLIIFCAISLTTIIIAATVLIFFKYTVFFSAYNIHFLIVTCVLICIVILSISFIFTKLAIQPLSQLVKNVTNLNDGKFKEYLPTEGPLEVRQLAVAYNYIQKNMQGYIEQLSEALKQQQKYEIKALQMQINPHYIYNTLSSIKWLVYQNDTQKTICTIDAFIRLLRTTISDTHEFITIEQELNLIQDYIFINHTRYGEAVNVEYYVSHTCYSCLIPKMILQPFIENAFFHAFPCGKTGAIQIFIKQKKENLEIQIIDNGVGIDPTDIQQILYSKASKEHFSGIGIHNVQERLKLLYGESYDVQIDSIKGQQTTVTVNIPAKHCKIM